MRWKLEWWMRRTVPSAMNGRRSCRVGSKRRPSALFITTLIRAGSTPRAIESMRSGSWTVMISSAIRAETRVAAVTSGRSGRSHGLANRSRKNSGMSSCRSSRSGTPPSFCGSAPKARKSGTVATCTRS
jgi:hypothetical protein